MTKTKRQEIIDYLDVEVGLENFSSSISLEGAIFEMEHGKKPTRTDVCKGFVSMEDCKTRVHCDMLYECEDYLQAENDECNKRNSSSMQEYHDRVEAQL
jgi:hypothetical protein